jgi:hypothetical protein
VAFGFFFLRVGVGVGLWCVAGLHLADFFFVFFAHGFDACLRAGADGAPDGRGVAVAPTMPGPTAIAGTASSKTSSTKRRMYSSRNL